MWGQHTNNNLAENIEYPPLKTDIAPEHPWKKNSFFGAFKKA